MHRDEVSSLETFWICDFGMIRPSGRSIIPNSKVLVSERACGPTVVECETARVEDLDDRGECGWRLNHQVCEAVPMDANEDLRSSFNQILVQ